MRMRWVGVVVLFPFLMSGAAYADGDGGQVGVILKAGEIDSSRVKAGAFAVVIHGQGKRHPVSGEWEHLDTARGYIQSVDWQQQWLILAQGRDGQRKRIALDHIQTLVMLRAHTRKGESRATSLDAAKVEKRTAVPSAKGQVPHLDGAGADAAAVAEPTPSRAAEDSVQATGSRRQVIKYSHRQPWREERDIGFAFKCGIGASVGILSAVAGFLIFLPFAECADPDGGQEPLIFCNEWVGPPMQAAKIGFLAGTASGVTLVDPYRKFTYLYALAGSWVGLQVARELADRMGYPPRESYVAMAFYIGVPAAMAALASEGMRGFHKEPRFSVGLAPDRGGSMSVVATLRF